MDEEVRQFWVAFRAALLKEAKDLQELRASKLQLAASIKQMTQTPLVLFLAGENLSAGDDVCLHLSDGKVYKAIAGQEDARNVFTVSKGYTKGAKIEMTDGLVKSGV